MSDISTGEPQRGEGRYRAPLSGIFDRQDLLLDRIGAREEVEVVLKLATDSEDSQKAQTRIEAAFEEYKAAYPADSVGLDDFKYVGIASGSGDDNYKDDVIDAIGAGYDDMWSAC